MIDKLVDGLLGFILLILVYYGINEWLGNQKWSQPTKIRRHLSKETKGYERMKNAKRSTKTRK